MLILRVAFNKGDLVYFVRGRVEYWWFGIYCFGNLKGRIEIDNFVFFVFDFMGIMGKSYV